MSSRITLGTWLTVAAFTVAGSAGVAVAVVTSTPAEESTTGTVTSVSPSRPSGARTPVSVDADHRVHLAATLQPGVRHLVVSAVEPAVVQLVRPAAGYTRVAAAADIDAAYGARGDDAARQRFEARTTALGGVSASLGHPGELWQRLTTGTYWLLDTKAGRYTTSDLTVVTVSGRPVTGVLAADTTLTVTGDDTWAASPRSIAGSGVLRLTNHGTRDHAASVVRLLPGTTMADVRAYLADPDADEADRPWSGSALSTGTVSPGSSVVLDYSLLSGRYALLGWWPDAQGVGNDVNALVRQIRIG